MARKGRKRKSGRRHPSGQLVVEKKPDDRVRTSRQPHRRHVDQDDRLSEHAESPFGRLRLNEEISETAYQAGEHFQRVVGQYRSVIEAPRGTGGAGRGAECSVLCRRAHELLDAKQRQLVHDGLFDTDVCSCLSSKWRYQAAYETVMALGARRGRRAIMALNRVVLQGEELPRSEIVYLVDGLAVLERHFGLTGSRRR